MKFRTSVTNNFNKFYNDGILKLMQENIDIEVLQSTILKWISKRLDAASFKRLKDSFNHLSKSAEDWEIFSSFSEVPRITGKKKLELELNEAKEADRIRSDWRPAYWQIDQLSRTLLLLSIATRGKEDFLDKIEKLFISSDIGEAVALYQSLPVLPYPDQLTHRATEGIRSIITYVFKAVVLRNPYPRDYLDEDAWNQVILKSLFVGSPLYLIQGVDLRSNKNLAYMLVEYAHERWAAGREVSPELWRPVGPFINEEYIDDIKKVLSHPDLLQKQAAVLALSDSNSELVTYLLNQNKDILKSIKKENITWNGIGKSLHDKTK